MAGILERLGSSRDLCQARLERLPQHDRLFGVVFATNLETLRNFATTRGVSKRSNLTGRG